MRHIPLAWAGVEQLSWMGEVNYSPVVAAIFGPLQVEQQRQSSSERLR